MAQSNLKTLTHDDYGVAIICPLEIEMSAMRSMLDEEHARVPSINGESDHWICGELCGHNVVIGYLPQESQGIGAVAVVATNIIRSFPHATLRLLVGIGGGVPSKTNDIRLGDVVVSMPTATHSGVVQYDLGKNTVAGFERKGFLMPPPTLWRNRVVRVQSDYRLWGSQIPAFIDAIIKKYPHLTVYCRPAGIEEVLFLPHNEHISGQSTCERCNHNDVVDRSRRANNVPTVFYGLIASGNQVIKNAVTRDQIARDAGGALCFEMEAAGLMNDFQCIVIRGIADYADSHKNDVWHGYAAAVAAGYTKELLLHVNPERDIPVLDRNQHWTIKQTVNPSFTGRTKLVNEISDSIRKALQNTSSLEQCRIVITGMGGQGKSEICLNVANKVRPLLWGIFWVDVDTKSSAESGFALIGNRLKLPTSTINDVLQHLANAKQPWLLILDNADDADVDYQQYFPSGSTGIILLTSRNRECHIYATHATSPLDGLPLVDACTLLEKSLQPPTLRLRNALRTQPHSQDQISQEQLKSVAVSLLNGHPLAIIQAGAYISQGHCSIAQYPKVFEQQRKRLLTFRMKQAQSRYGNVYATFEASADILQTSKEKTAEDALQLLSVLSMFGPNNFPTSVFETAWNGAQRVLRMTGIEQGPQNSSNDIDLLCQWHLDHLLPLMDFKSCEWDPFRLTEAVRLLEAYSLVMITGIEGSMTISMHPLAHAWAKDRQLPASLRESWLHAGCTLAVAYPTPAIELIDQQLRPHLSALLKIESSVLRETESRVMITRLLIQVGRVLQELLLDKELFELWQIMFEWLNLDVRTVDSEWLPLYELAGYSLQRHGRYREAVAILEQVVEKRDETLPEHDTKRLESNKILPEAYQVNRQTQQAINILRPLVKLEEQTFGEADSSLLRSQHRLAGAYLDNGQAQEAIELFEEVVRLQQSLAEDHPNRLAAQHELARAYLMKGQVQQAVDLLKEVVRLRQSLAEDLPNRLASEQVLATALWRLGQWDKSFQMMQEVAAKRGKIYPEGHNERRMDEGWLAHMRKGLGLETESDDGHLEEEDTKESRTNMQENSNESSAPRKPESKSRSEGAEENEELSSRGTEEDLARRAETLQLE